MSRRRAPPRLEDEGLSLEDSMGSVLSKRTPSDMGAGLGGSLSDDLDTAANGDWPKGLTRAAYARKVFVALKTGYLMKKSTMTPAGQKNTLGKMKFLNFVAKRRYFVLTGASLMYHHDHKNLDDSLNSKEILLDEDSTISSCDMPSAGLGIELIAGGMVTQLGAKDEAEMREWQAALSSVIKKLKGQKRGYLLKLRAGVPTPSPLPLTTAPLSAAITSGDFKHVPPIYASDKLLEGKGGAGEWSRKYFIVDGGKLTFHASHSSTLIVQGSFKLPPTTQVEVRQGKLLVVRNATNELVCRAADEGELEFWESAIKDAVKENAARRAKIMEARASRGEDPLAVTDELDDTGDQSGSFDSNSGADGASADEQGIIRSKGFDASHGGSFSGLPGAGGGSLLKGDLATRPTAGDGPWKPAHYVLEKGRLLVFEDRHHVRPKQVHKISPSCSVYETKLKAFSFELVVAGKVLHLQGSTFEDSLRWIATLKAAINNSPPDDTDPLLAEALKLEDTFYYADFATKQPLGVVLERSKEWAIVKMANSELSEVSVGSALASVNGESVVLRPYDETIEMLTGWKPPLNLIFRRAPVREGWLKLATVGKKEKVWVDLREGKLSWYKQGPAGTLLGQMPMVGSAVALLPPEEVGAPHCLSVVAGVAAVVMRALNRKDVVSWAAHIYQASAVANGGGYLLDQERDQEVAYEEERRRRLELEAAERERFARNKKENTQQQQQKQQQQEQEKDANDVFAEHIAGQASSRDEALSNGVDESSVISADARALSATDSASLGEELDETSVSTPGALAEHGEVHETTVSREGSFSASPAAGKDAAPSSAGVEAAPEATEAEVRADSPVLDGDEKGPLEQDPSSKLKLSLNPADGAVGGDASSSAAAGDEDSADAIRRQRLLVRKPSSVMELIRQREAAAKEAQLPLSARKQEVPATPMSPSLAAVRQRKVGAWGGSATAGAGAAAGEEDAGEEAGADRGGGPDRQPSAATVTPEPGKILSPSLAAARTRGLPAWNVAGGARGGSSSTSFASEAATAGRRPSRGDSSATAPSMGTEEPSQPQGAGSGSKDADVVAPVPVAVDARANDGGERPVSPSLAAAQKRGLPDRSAWSGRSAAAAPLQPQQQQQRKKQQPEPEVDAAALRITASAPSPAGVAKVLSPSLAAARSRGLPDRSAWSGGGSSLASTAPAATASKRSSEENGRVLRVGGEATPKAPIAAATTSAGDKEPPAEAARPDTRPFASTTTGGSGGGGGGVAAAYARALASSKTAHADAEPSSSGSKSATRAAKRGTANGGAAKPKSVAAAYARAASGAFNTASTAETTTPSPTAAGGSSLSPVTTPGAGGAAARAATSASTREGDGLGGTGVKALGAKLFSSTGGFPGLAPSGPFQSTVEVRRSSGPPEPSRGPVGGPWDEEKILEWVRDVTKMDIDPECGVHFSLKDGVALCRLMSKLRPGEPMDEPSDSSSAYKQMANIFAFLRACRSIGLGDSILFETPDLYEANDIPAVVKTLVALGESLPQTCPKYRGPKLDMRKFSWSTAAAPSSSGRKAAGGSAGKARGTSANAFRSTPSRLSAGTIGGGTWPPPGSAGGQAPATTNVGGGGRGVSGLPGGTWRRVMGQEHPANSGEDDDTDDDDYDAFDDDEDDDDDDDDGEDNDEDGHGGVVAGVIARSNRIAAMINRGGSAAAPVSEELTDEDLGKAYTSVEKASRAGGLSPLQFSSLWRSLSGGKENMFVAMSMFRKFNTSGNSVIDFEEFKAGFRLLAKESPKEHELVLRNLRDWGKSQPASF